MKFSASGMAIIACVIAAPATAFAAGQHNPRPEVLRKLVDCRAVANDAERLACYDAQVAALDSAEARNEVVVVDKNQIRTAKKTLFGLSLPTLAIFGGSNNDDASAKDEQLSEIESTIASATAMRGTPDRWAITIEDGARWTQTESKRLPRSPKPGMPIKIRKAGVGGYFANIDGQTAIRVQRAN